MASAWLPALCAPTGPTRPESLPRLSSASCSLEALGHRGGLPGRQGRRPPLRKAPWSGNPTGHSARESEQRAEPQQAHGPCCPHARGPAPAKQHLRVAHGHGLARLPRAELRDGAVLQVDMVEKRRGCKREGPGVTATSGERCSVPEPWGGLHLPQTGDEGPAHRMGLGCLPAALARRVGHTSHLSERPGPLKLRAPLLPTPAGSGVPLGTH